MQLVTFLSHIKNLATIATTLGKLGPKIKLIAPVEGRLYS